MSELISGKEALIALANGEEVEFYHNNCWSWVGEMIIIKHFVDDSFQFRIKPRTITINGITCHSEDEAVKLIKEFFI